ncbi:hypothetical protein ABIB94_007083 [Bradyrhizobium sp. JR7.2]|uniref:hypothetical protein n=1 Tax=Bradyrhizobium sp. JR7.2 TaxID=3156375 RepID=UPI003392BFB8
MSKLHDDLINEVESSESVSEGVDSLMRAIADRIEGCQGNKVKLSDLCTILREDTSKVADAVVANTDVAKVNKTRTTGYDAPSPVFDKPRDDVRMGMPMSSNDHRDQQFPENENTEAEREQIRREQALRDRGGILTAQTDLPDVPEADRKAEEDRKRAEDERKAREENRQPA